MTKKDAETDETPETPARQTFTPLAKKLDAAVREADEKRAAVAAAQTALDTANADLAELMRTIQTLAQEQKTMMDDILSVGGTVHVAT